MVDCWYHPKCFVQKREELGFRPEFSASQLMGFSVLTAEDQETLKKQLPGITGERWVDGWGWGVPREGARGQGEDSAAGWGGGAGGQG